MLDDQAIWKAIGEKHSFCSFKMMTETETLCRNANNVSGICSREMCPLANSKYATVRTMDDKVFLLLKEPERARNPKKLYEKIQLDEDYDKALEQIEKEMKGWSKLLKHKCKQRLTKLFEYLERKALLDAAGRPVYLRRKRKTERQDRAREIKASRAAKIEETLAQELLERYKAGVYGKKIVLEQEVKTDQERRREKQHRLQTKGIKYVVDFETEEPEEEKKKKKIKMKMDW